MDEDASNIVALARAISRSDPSSPLSRVVSRRADVNGPSVLGVPMSDPPDSTVGEEEAVEQEDRSMKGAVKGFLGKLRPRHGTKHESTSPHASTDEVC